MLKKTDWLWLLAYPVYQTIGTLRHEGSHALAAIAQGAEIHKFVFLPTFSAEAGLRWGYVQWYGQTSWITTAAPYFCDLLTAVCFFILLMSVRIRPRWLWLNLGIIGLLSPLLNSLYNYLGGLFRSNDIGRLLLTLPALPVHLFFITSMSFYILVIIVVMKRRRGVN